MRGFAITTVLCVGCTQPSASYHEESLLRADELYRWESSALSDGAWSSPVIVGDHAAVTDLGSDDSLAVGIETGSDGELVTMAFSVTELQVGAADSALLASRGRSITPLSPTPLPPTLRALADSGSSEPVEVLVGLAHLAARRPLLDEMQDLTGGELDSPEVQTLRREPVGMRFADVSGDGEGT